MLLLLLLLLLLLFILTKPKPLYTKRRTTLPSPHYWRAVLHPFQDPYRGAFREKDLK